MITPEAMQVLMNSVCLRTARKAAERIPGYDLPKVESHLDMMAQENPST